MFSLKITNYNSTNIAEQAVTSIEPTELKSQTLSYSIILHLAMSYIAT